MIFTFDQLLLIISSGGNSLSCGFDSLSQALVIDDFKLLTDPEARDMVMKFLARKGYVFITGNEFRLESDTQRILFHLLFLF